MIKQSKKKAKRTKRQCKSLGDKKFNRFFEFKTHISITPGSSLFAYKESAEDMFSENYGLFYGDKVYPSKSVSSMTSNITVKEACRRFNWDVATTLSIIPALLFRNKIRIDFKKGHFVRFFPPPYISHVLEFVEALGAVENFGNPFYDAIGILRIYGFLHPSSEEVYGTIIGSIFNEWDPNKEILADVILTDIAPEVIKNQVKKIVEELCGVGFFKEDVYDNAVKNGIVPDTKIIKVPKDLIGDRRVDFLNFNEFLESNDINISHTDGKIIHERLYHCLSRKCCISPEDSLIYAPPLYLSGSFGFVKNILFDLSAYDIRKSKKQTVFKNRVPVPEWVREEMFEYSPYPIDIDIKSEKAQIYKWGYMYDQKWDDYHEKRLLERHYADKEISLHEMKERKSMKVVHAHLINAVDLRDRGLPYNNAEYMTLCTDEYHAILDRHDTLGDKLRFLVADRKVTMRKAKQLALRAIHRLEEESSREADLFVEELREDCKEILSYRKG